MVVEMALIKIALKGIIIYVFSGQEFQCLLDKDKGNYL